MHHIAYATTLDVMFSFGTIETTVKLALNLIKVRRLPMKRRLNGDSMTGSLCGRCVCSLYFTIFALVHLPWLAPLHHPEQLYRNSIPRQIVGAPSNHPCRS